MRHQFTVLGRLFTIAQVSLLLLSTHWLWAQRMPPLEGTPVRLFVDRTMQFAPVPEPSTHPPRVFGKLPLSLAANFQASQRQIQSGVRFFPGLTGDYHMPIDNKAAFELRQPAGTDERLGRTKYFTAPNQWLTVAPAYGKTCYPTTYRANDLEYYGHHIPWAGSFALRVCQQAKAHPQVTRILKLFTP